MIFEPNNTGSTTPTSGNIVSNLSGHALWQTFVNETDNSESSDKVQNKVQLKPDQQSLKQVHYAIFHNKYLLYIIYICINNILFIS